MLGNLWFTGTLLDGCSIWLSLISKLKLLWPGFDGREYQPISASEFPEILVKNADPLTLANTLF